jgi:hypothetical protein
MITRMSKATLLLVLIAFPYVTPYPWWLDGIAILLVTIFVEITTP